MTKSIDALEVMNRAIESAGLMVKESRDMRAVAYQDDLFKARAAVAELIEASAAYADGEYHDRDTESSADYNSRRRKERYRLMAAINRSTISS